MKLVRQPPHLLANGTVDSICSHNYSPFKAVSTFGVNTHTVPQKFDLIDALIDSYLAFVLNVIIKDLDGTPSLQEQNRVAMSAD